MPLYPRTKDITLISASMGCWYPRPTAHHNNAEVCSFIRSERHVDWLLYDTRWLKINKVESPELGHLKRIRKQGEAISLLLNDSPTPPPLPSDLNLSEPYTLAVPRTAALTINALHLKSSLWPTTYAPRKKGEIEPWSKLKAKWAWDSMRVVIEAAKVKPDGDVSIIISSTQFIMHSHDILIAANRCSYSCFVWG